MKNVTAPNAYHQNIHRLADDLEEQLQAIDEKKAKSTCPKKRTVVEMDLSKKAQTVHNAIAYVPPTQVNAAMAVHHQSNVDIIKLL